MKVRSTHAVSASAVVVALGVSLLSGSALIAVASGGAAATELSSAVSPAAGSSAWTTQLQKGPVTFSVPSVSCSGSLCVGAGGAGTSTVSLPVSDDDGVDWTMSPIPVSVGFVRSVSCATSEFCVGVGADLSDSSYKATAESTTDGGKKWKADTLPSGFFELYGVSCFSSSGSSICEAVGATGDKNDWILGTTDEGKTWSKQTLPSDATVGQAVDCSSLVDCVAGGSGSSGSLLFTTDGGIEWQDSSSASSQAGRNVDSISCSSTADCTATTNSPSLNTPELIETTDGGVTWVSENQPTGFGYFDDVWCGSASDCIVVGQSTSISGLISTTSNGGDTWNNAAASPGIGGFDGVSCNASGDCVAAGFSGEGISNFSQGAAEVSSDAGSTWIPTDLPTALWLNGVSCYSTSNCLAVGYDNNGASVLATSDAGTKWTSSDVAGLGVDLQAISCTGTGFCAAVGIDANDESGEVLTTDDGGADWTTDSVPEGVVNLLSVSCSSASDCVAGGSTNYLARPGEASGDAQIISTSNGGATWTASSDLSGSDWPVLGVSCWSTSDCVAAGNGALYSTDGGSTWTSGKRYAATAAADTCTSSTDCIAVGKKIFTTDDGGSIWAKATAPTDVYEYLGVSCSTTNDCITVGSGSIYSAYGVSAITKNGGATWRSAPIPVGVDTPSAISCEPEASCEVVATNNNGGAVIIGN